MDIDAMVKQISALTARVAKLEGDVVAAVPIVRDEMTEERVRELIAEHSIKPGDPDTGEVGVSSLGTTASAFRAPDRGNF